MPGTLYLVATPIGNLADITNRALQVLRDVDLIACEDTRHTRKLLNHFAITTATISYHEHNEQERAAKLCEVLESGKNVALVSDAGTPLVSDPGFRVVQAAVDRGISVVPIPGASAVITALSVSGLPTDQFLFAGFLPARTGARRAKLDELRTVAGSLVFYEAPHRIKATLQDAREVLGNREAVIAREVTKLHEEFARGSLSQLIEQLSNSQVSRGEMVLIISGQAAELPSLSTIDPNIRLGERIEQLEGEGMDQKSALKQAAKELGMKRADAYRVMVNQKNRRSK